MVTTLLAACACLSAQPAKGEMLPTGFIENRGQWPAEAKFVARSGALDLWVTTTGLRYVWHGPKAKDHVVSVQFVGSSGKGQAFGEAPVSTPLTYAVGTSPNQRVRVFSKATVRGLYPGIDLKLSLDRGKPRYDLVVNPGAKPSTIAMRYRGADAMSVSHKGELSYRTPFGTVTLRRQ